MINITLGTVACLARLELYDLTPLASLTRLSFGLGYSSVLLLAIIKKEKYIKILV